MSLENSSSLFENINLNDVKKYYNQEKINLKVLDINPYYSKNNLAIYLIPEYSKIIEESGITESALCEILEDNLTFAAKYTNASFEQVHNMKLDYLILKDGVFKEYLRLRETKLRSLFANEDFNKGIFLNILGNKIKEPNDLFDLFTFDYDKIFKKIYSPYIFILTDILNNNKLGDLITKKNMIDHNLWNMPVFNTPRDIILKSREDLQYFIDNLHISPEYRLMKLLLEEKIIKHNFSIGEIDYILSVYRCCIGGKSLEIHTIFKENSKYYNVLPFISGSDCELNESSKDFCEKNLKSEFKWSPFNNSVGYQSAAATPIIFPYVFVSDNLESRFDDTVKLNEGEYIGTLIIKNDNVKKKKDKPYYIIYIKISKTVNEKGTKNEVMFFDIYGNRVHLKDAPISFQRIQYLESKWSIYRLIWLLEHTKVIPYTDKKCDVYVYKSNKKTVDNKDLYLLSLFNRSQINNMYNELRTSLQKIEDTSKRKLVDDLIQTLISEFKNYEDIANYKLYNEKGETLFIWQINKSNLNLWRTSFRGNNIIKKCVKSELFINMLSGETHFYKDDLTLDFNKNETLLDSRYHKKIYYNAVKYHQDEAYAKKIDEQKIIVENKLKEIQSKSTLEITNPEIIWYKNHQQPSEIERIKYIKYKIKYLKLKNIISSTYL